MEEEKILNLIEKLYNEMQSGFEKVNGELAKIRETMATKKELAEVKASMATELAEVKASMATEIAEVKTSMATEIAEVKTSIATEIAEIKESMATKDELAKVKASMATKDDIAEINRKLNAVIEQTAFLLEFRTEVIEELYIIRKDVSYLTSKVTQNDIQIVELRRHIKEA